MRMLGALRVLGGLVVGGMAFASSAAAGPPPALALDPDSGPAGTDAVVSGSCPAGKSASLTFQAVREDPTDEVFFVQYVRPPTAPDGTFAGPLSIPAEAAAGTWRVDGSCVESDGGLPLPGFAEFTVTGGPGAPLTISAATAAPLGSVVRVTGSGCTVDGRVLPEATVAIIEGDTRELGRATAPVAADASWVVDIRIDAGPTPGSEVFLTAGCGDPSDFDPRWGRARTVPFQVLAPTGTPPTSTPPTVLARTGPDGGDTTQAGLLGTLLVAAGIGAVTASRRWAAAR